MSTKIQCAYRPTRFNFEKIESLTFLIRFRVFLINQIIYDGDQN